LRESLSLNIYLVMMGGEQPKKVSTIAKEKGTPTEDKKCPSVQCAQEPVAGDDGPVCEKSSENESERIKALGDFRECCEMWKCAYQDGSYYTHFGKTNILKLYREHFNLIFFVHV
jgi:hypothetical protein